MYNTKRQTSSKILHFLGKKYGHNCLFLRKKETVYFYAGRALDLSFFNLGRFWNLIEN